jgi:dihydropteroate synthase
MFDTTPTLDCGGRKLALDQPRIMGVINVTPDSFSDGGAFLDADAAVAHGVTLADEGADVLDVGGESTRPGAADVSIDEEIRRVVPVIERLAKQVAIPIAIDTSRPEVMRAAVVAGAGMINDVRALRGDGAMDTAADLGVPVCLVHMQGDPRSMQDDPQYDDVVADVHRFLTERLFACQMGGLDKKRLLVDPGFGFGKTAEHNLALLRALDRFAGLGCPLLVGLSRKTTLGVITGRPVGERLVASVVAALIAAQRGAAIVRVHDVAATRDALLVWQAVKRDGPLVSPARKADAARRARLLEED